MSSQGGMTPMLRHYLQVKEENPGALLLYRMGDFYELFFEDAEEAAPLLEVVLTARQKGTESEAPMCGIPHHALENYLRKLVRAGRKVAICDQVEDPKTAKGLVRREVTRVVTPGTLSEPELLDGTEPNLLASVVWDNGSGAGAFLDVSTGELVLHRWRSPGELLEDLGALRPTEVLWQSESVPQRALQWAAQYSCVTELAGESRLSGRDADGLLKRHFGVASLRGLGLEAGAEEAIAAAAALRYAGDNHRTELGHVKELRRHQAADYALLDETTLRNLEVLETQRERRRRGSLRGHLDRCRTAMGSRRLRGWLVRPLLDRRQLLDRLDAVEELGEQSSLRAELAQRLRQVADIDRLASRAALGSLQPREAVALRASLQELAALQELVRSAHSGLLQEVAGLDPVSELEARLRETLAEEVPSKIGKGTTIRPGFDEELDATRSLAMDGKSHLMALESEERQRSGIGSLKVGYNRVFGYYLEIGKAHQDAVPESYIRKQTLTNSERYITPELKELEERILGAEERVLALEETLFDRLREQIAERTRELQRLAAGAGTLDVLLAFADVARERDYCRPQLAEVGRTLRLEDSRHPIVELSSGADFVPNDADLDGEETQIVLVTGPNMGGKSTYLRQVALIQLMAQIGSFVPCREARLSIVDRIFTRVGASDDLARGESTFMVEMIETANILRAATADSLVVLDEVGRGTATFDGLSLAWAIVEEIHERCHARTLFATHYHELTQLGELLPRVVNRTMAVKEWQGEIVFLHRVVPGAADKSYGLHVARLAGVPERVVERAAEILQNLERQELNVEGQPRLAEGPLAPAAEVPGQLPLFRSTADLVISLLRELEVEELTPMAALNLLHSLTARLDE